MAQGWVSGVVVALIYALLALLHIEYMRIFREYVKYGGLIPPFNYVCDVLGRSEDWYMLTSAIPLLFLAVHARLSGANKLVPSALLLAAAAHISLLWYDRNEVRADILHFKMDTRCLEKTDVRWLWR